jgi:hypothetical protein
MYGWKPTGATCDTPHCPMACFLDGQISNIPQFDITRLLDPDLQFIKNLILRDIFIRTIFCFVQFDTEYTRKMSKESARRLLSDVLKCPPPKIIQNYESLRTLAKCLTYSDLFNSDVISDCIA